MTKVVSREGFKAGVRSVGVWRVQMRVIAPGMYCGEMLGRGVRTAAVRGADAGDCGWDRGKTRARMRLRLHGRRIVVA